jgi:PTS system galactitol-specific IIA component
MPENEVMLDGLAIEERNILVKASAASSADIIRQLGALLYNNGFVKDTYVQAVLDREQVYPTGLQTSVLGFAIPHTDTEHVNKPALAVATLERPVIFRAMDDPGVEIPVNIVMMLAISDPESVVNVLRKVISILEDQPALLRLTHAASRDEIRQAVCDHIRSFVDIISIDSPLDFNH